MKKLKALKFLKEQRRRHQNMADSMKVVYFDDELDEAIKELEELNNRSCLSCKKYKGNIKKDCKTLTYEFNQQLKINGYLMNESEFYCSRHEAKWGVNELV